MGLNPFPEGSGDPGGKGKSLRHFPSGEDGGAGRSRRKGREEIMGGWGGWGGGGRGGRKGEGGGKGGREVERLVGVQGR